MLTCEHLCDAQYVGGDNAYTDKCKRYNPPTFLGPGPPRRGPGGRGGAPGGGWQQVVVHPSQHTLGCFATMQLSSAMLSCFSVCLLQRRHTAATTARNMATAMAMAATTRAVTSAMYRNAPMLRYVACHTHSCSPSGGQHHDYGS